MSLISSGLEYLSAMRKEHNSESVVYARGATTATLSATVGATQVQIADALQTGIEVTTVDFIVDIADLPVDEPATGDTITRTVGGQTLVYEAMPLASSEPSWRYTNELTRASARIHTKLVSVT